MYNPPYMSFETWVFSGIGLALIVAELFLGVSVGFDLVVIGGSFLVGGLATHLTGNTYAGIIATGLASTVYFAFLRVKVKTLLSTSTHKLNIDRLIGKHGVVTTVITPHKPGQVKVDGEVWRAQSNQDIAVDTPIVIEKFEGVTLHVVTKHS